MDTIKVAKLDENAVLPTRKHGNDAGMDLYAFAYMDFSENFRVPFTYSIEPGKVIVVETKVTVEIPEGFVGLVWPKSGSNHLIGGGVIDAGYQGEILVKVANTTNTTMVFRHGDPVAQLVIVPVVTPKVVEVSKENIHQVASSRGETGGIWKQATILSTVESVE